MSSSPRVRVTLEIEAFDGAKRLDAKTAKRIEARVSEILRDEYPDERIGGLWVHDVKGKER